MIALPPAPAPVRPRMLMIGTALVCAAGSMLFAGLLAMYLKARNDLGGTTAKWLPSGAKIPGIATNIMVIGMIGAVVLVSWAVYALRQGARSDTYIALALTAVFGVAVVNAQIYVWHEMKIGISQTQGQPFPLFFYVATGTLFAAIVTGVVFTLVMTFRTAGGRSAPKDGEGLSALTLYWYFLTAATTATWFVVYVNK